MSNANTSPNNWNQKIIDEFRSNAGKVGGPFSGSPLLLLTTTGAKTGRRLTNPLRYNRIENRLLVFGSKGGAPTHPAWYHNLVANPEVTVELGTDKFEARAVVIKGEERDRLFQQHGEEVPQFAEYQRKTSRKIPVIALERLD